MLIAQKTVKKYIVNDRSGKVNRKLEGMACTGVLMLY